MEEWHWYDEFKISKEQFAGRDTLELILEYRKLQNEMKRIQAGTRGVDYWGGLDDSVANELSAVEFEINRRATVEFDKAALESVRMEPGVFPVNAHYYAYVLHTVISQAADALNEGRIDNAKTILLSAAVNYDNLPRESINFDDDAE